MNQLLTRGPKGSSSGDAEHQNQPEAAQTRVERRRRAALRWKALKEWTRIHLRRAAHVAHGALAIHQAVGPASFLGISAALGAALTLTTLYTTSYAVTLDGDPVGVVADQSVVDQAIQEVEAEGSSLLGYDYQVQGDLDYKFALTLKTDITRDEEIEDYFYQQLNEVSDHLKK